MATSPDDPHRPDRLTRHAAQQANDEPRCYRVAGRWLLSSAPVPLLQPFVAASGPPAEHRMVVQPGLAVSGESPLLGCHGWAGERRLTVACTAAGPGYHLAVEGGGQLAIGADGRLLRLLVPASDPPLLVATLVLALALHQTWCLHAGAVAVRGRVLAFLGDSGAGKSTLVRHLHSRDEGWQRVADDILPITGTGHRVQALPRFPQPALAGHEQQTGADQLPLAAVYLLAPARDNRIVIETLAGREALMTLVRHSHGAGLLGRSLLARHLAGCAAITESVPVRRLSYPRQHRLLPQVAAALRDDLV